MPATINDSILNTVKKGLSGIAADYTAFDDELIMYINSNLQELYQLGVGTKNFSIAGADETWADFLKEDYEPLGMVQEFVTLNAKLTFDPPSSSFVVAHIQNRVKELTWRINVYVDPEMP